MLINLNVLYEDNHLIAVFKPAGVPVQPDSSHKTSLLDMVREYLRVTYKKPGNVFVGLIHRLDRPVSGIVLFAKTSKGASRLSSQFRDRTVTKIYYAILDGIPQKNEGKLVHYLIKNEGKNKVTLQEEEFPGSSCADLRYKVIEHNGNQCVVEIVLGTGRSHQIRAQMAAMGCPILGDKKYGSKKIFLSDAIALQASELSFLTATEPSKITLSIPRLELGGLSNVD